MPLPRPLLALPALLAVAAVPVGAQQQTSPSAARAEFITSNPTAPFSQIVRVGETIYLAGMLGTAAGGKLAPGGIGPETRQALTNIRTALARVGATLDDAVRCTVFLADMKEWEAMNEAYVPFFPTHRPARSAVAVQGLARDARVEIECTAVRGAGRGAPPPGR